MKKTAFRITALLLSISALLVFCSCSCKNDEITVTTTASSAVSTVSSTDLTAATESVSTSATLSSAAVVSSDASASVTGSSSGISESVSSSETGAATSAAGAAGSTYATGQQDTKASQAVELFHEYNDTRLAKYFKKYDMNSFYIKVKSEKKGLTATREYASQNGAVYSSLEDENSKIIYLSIKNVTFSLDPAEKTYTVHLLYPLSLEYVYDGCIGAGETVFEGKKCIYEAFYDNYTGGIICHLFDQSGNWIAYEEYEGDEIIQTNYVKAVSGSIPSHVFFEIPSGYRYYYEDTVVTFPSGWFD